MNEQLINFIDLCLSDGILTEKEREVIFRKASILGVPDDECEIILNAKLKISGAKYEVDEGKKTNTSPRIYVSPKANKVKYEKLAREMEWQNEIDTLSNDLELIKEKKEAIQKDLIDLTNKSASYIDHIKRQDIKTIISNLTGNLMTEVESYLFSKYETEIIVNKKKSPDLSELVSNNDDDTSLKMYFSNWISKYLYIPKLDEKYQDKKRISTLYLALAPISFLGLGFYYSLELGAFILSGQLILGYLYKKKAQSYQSQKLIVVNDIAESIDYVFDKKICIDELRNLIKSLAYHKQY
ncbi:hypothetical protein BA6E_102291 [Bacteroidales bacterium 6E]|nr:hypothetical protein BA6E_102291 [Bacteroidales bacterium 6E]